MYCHMPDFDHGDPHSVAHTPENPFLFALKGPFALTPYAALPPSAALFDRVMSRLLTPRQRFREKYHTPPKAVKDFFIALSDC